MTAPRTLLVGAALLLAVESVTSSVAELPYANDPLHADFSGWAKGMHRPLVVIGQSYEYGRWQDAQWLCTAPVIYASEWI